MIGWIERIASEFGDSPSPSAIPASLFATAEAAGFPDERLPFDLMGLKPFAVVEIDDARESPATRKPAGKKGKKKEAK